LSVLFVIIRLVLFFHVLNYLRGEFNTPNSGMK